MGGEAETEVLGVCIPSRKQVPTMETKGAFPQGLGFQPACSRFQFVSMFISASVRERIDAPLLHDASGIDKPLCPF